MMPRTVCFFDAGARLGADVHQDLPGIHRREEVLAQKRPEAEREGNEGEEASDHHDGTFEGERQQRAVTAAHRRKHPLKSFLKTLERIASTRSMRVIFGL